LSEVNPLMEVAVAKISKKYNMPPEQVRAILQPLFAKKDVVKSYEELATRLDSLKSLLDKLPEEARAELMVNVVREAISSSPKQQSPTDVIAIREVLRELRDDDPDTKRLEEEVKALKELVMSLKEQMSAKSTLDEVLKKFESLEKRIEALEAKMSQPPATSVQTHAGGLEELKKMFEERFKALESTVAELKKQPQAPRNMIAEALKELDETIKLAQQYNLIKPATTSETKEFNPDQMAEVLKKYGYRVEKITPEELDKVIQEYKERIKAEIEREMNMDRMKMETAVNIIRDVIKEIGGPIVKTITDVQKEYLSKSLSLRLQQLAQSQQQVQSQPKQEQVQPQQESK